MIWIPIDGDQNYKIFLVVSHLPAVDHELVDGSWTAGGRGLVVPCVGYLHEVIVCKL